jgi:hypothetical protein
VRPARRHQPVLDVVDVGVGPVRGEVAVEVVQEARPTGGAVLVEPVGRVIAIDGVTGSCRRSDG